MLFSNISCALYFLMVSDVMRLGNSEVYLTNHIWSKCRGIRWVFRTFSNISPHPYLYFCTTTRFIRTTNTILSPHWYHNIWDFRFREPIFPPTSPLYHAPSSADRSHLAEMIVQCHTYTHTHTHTHTDTNPLKSNTALYKPPISRRYNCQMSFRSSIPIPNCPLLVLLTPPPHPAAQVR